MSKIPILTIFSLFCLTLSCCSQKNASETRPTIDVDSIKALKNRSVTRTAVSDTICGAWEIKTFMAPNGKVVYNGSVGQVDNSAFVTLRYNGKDLMTDREFTTADILGSEGDYAMYTGAEPLYIAPRNVYFMFNFYVPETDVGWETLCCVSFDGKISMLYLDSEMGDGCATAATRLSAFFSVFFNERAKGATIDELKPWIERYFDTDAANSILNGDITIDSNVKDYEEAIRSYLTTCISENFTEVTDGKTVVSGKWECSPGVSDSIFLSMRDNDSKFVELYRQATTDSINLISEYPDTLTTSLLTE